MINGRRVRIVVVALGAIFGALALIAIARQAGDQTATSDMAVAESFTLLASQGNLLLGSYSRFQWHHPGPLYFFWMAPFYVLSGSRTTGLEAGALALNLGALAVIAWTLRRRASATLALAIGGATAAFAWRVPELLTSPWSAHVPVIPAMALLVAAAAAVSGARAVLPGVAVLASLVGQTYVGVLPMAIAVGGVTLVGSVAMRWFPATERRSVWRIVLATGLALAVVWAPPIVEQVTERPGNLTLLWAFFVSDVHPGQTFGRAVSVWADMLSGMARPDFYLAHGWRFVESPVKWAEALAVTELAALLVACLRAWRLRRPFELSLASLLLLASMLALWSATRIEGEIFDQNIFWVSGIGVLNLGMLVALLADLWLEGARARSRPAWIAGAACAVYMAGTTAFGVSELREAAVRSRSPGVESRAASAVAHDLQEYLDQRQVVRPLIRFDQEAWGMVAGVVLQLQKAGVPVAVEDDWIAMFTPAFAATGHEPLEIAIAGKAEHVRLSDRPGDLVVASRDPLYAHALNR